MLHFWHQVFMKCFKTVTFWRHFSKNFIALTFSVRPQWPHSSRWVSCSEAWIPDLLSIFSHLLSARAAGKEESVGEASLESPLEQQTSSPASVPELAHVVLLKPSAVVGLHPASTRPGRPMPWAGWEPTTFYIFFPFYRDRWIHPDKPPGTLGGHLSSIQGRNIYLYFSLSFGCLCHV